MQAKFRGPLLVGCLTSVLELASCKEGTADRLENVGGSGNTAGSAGASSLAGSGGASSQAGSGTGGAPVDAGMGGASGGAGGRAPIPGQNLIANPSFEQGEMRWIPIGPCTLSVVNDVAHSGSMSLLVANRSNTWNGANHDIEELVVPGTRYEVRAWVRPPPLVPDGGAFQLGQRVGITLRRLCPASDPAGGVFTSIAEATLQDGWIELSATFEPPTCELDYFSFYIEGPPPGVNFYVDDVSLAALP